MDPTIVLHEPLTILAYAQPKMPRTMLSWATRMSRLERLQISHRCLDQVDIDLTSPEDGKPSPFFALVGANGAGKTTVLDAIAQTVHAALRYIDRPSYIATPPYSVFLHFEPSFILRAGAGLKRICHEDVAIASQPIKQTWSKTLYVPSGYLPIMQTGASLVPGPKWGMTPDQALQVPPAASRIDAIHQWWLHKHWEYPQTATLDRLWEALRPFLHDRVYAGVNPDDHLPQFQVGDTSVSFNQLSSGERRLVLLFMEIAMHCGEDGLLLFDEPEAHFHPLWQGMLRDAFRTLLPRGQAIVATHSPHLIDGMPAHQLLVMGKRPW